MNFAKSPRARAARPPREARLAVSGHFPYKIGRLATLLWHGDPRTQNYTPALFGGYIRGEKRKESSSRNREDSI